MERLYSILNKDGVVFNVPDEECVKHLLYSYDGVFRVVSYKYKDIVETHHNSIDNEEFVSTLKCKPATIYECVKNTSTYCLIEETLKNKSVLPVCAGLVRHILYTLASENCPSRNCSTCIHRSYCMTQHEFGNAENTYPDVCDKYLNEEAFAFRQVNNILTKHFVDIISHFTCYEQFNHYLLTTRTSRVLLRSLGINYIVFLNNDGRIGRDFGGYATTFDEVDKAMEYKNFLVESKTTEAKKFGYADTLTVVTDGDYVDLKFKSRFGSQTVTIHFCKV